MMKKQKIMLYRIIAAAVIYVPLFVLEHMGKLEFQSEIPVQFLLFMIPYLIVGWDIIYRAVRNISHGQVFDENFLMCIATFGALGVKEYSEAVAVMLFYQIGELFQSYAVNRSRQSISAMMDICPEYANIEEDGKLKQVDPDDVEIGTEIVIKAGERVPLDGVVVSGTSFVDTSALTGESVPREVTEGSEIISGCVNGSGLLKVRTTKEFDDSTVAKILELVENASSKKGTCRKLHYKVCKILYADRGLCGSCTCIPSTNHSWRWICRMDSESMYFPCNLLPMCTGDLCSTWFFWRNRSSIQTGRSGKGKQLSGSTL